MHKKLEAELVGLAHSILQMKNKDDVNALRKKALAIYEKLSVLKFVESYIETAPDLEQTEEELIDEIEPVTTDKVEVVEKEEVVDEIEPVTTDKVEVEEKEEVVEVEEKIIEEELIVEKEEVVEVEEKIIEEELIVEEEDVIEVEELVKEEEVLNEDEVDVEEIIKDEEQDISSLQFSLEDEFKDAISADVATQLFEKATKENPVIEEVPDVKHRSLNDALYTSNLQIGLNDRIAFVKHLFDGSQEDFNRVLSQLNSFKTEDEAKNFVHKFVKPDYNWSTKEEYEHRLINLIERKFL